MLTDGLNNYVYDGANRLTSATDSAQNVTIYAYDGLGDRYRRSTNGVSTNFLLDLNSSLPQVLGENTNGAQTDYLLGLDVIAQQQSGQWGYFGYDGLGSVRQMSDPAGALTYSAQY